MKMIGLIIKALSLPVVEAVGIFMKNKTKVESMREETKRVAINADASVRSLKLGYCMGRVPLFIAEFSAACYFSAILWDSYVITHGWFSPLELPKWFQPQFALAMGSIFGLALAQRYLGKPK